MASKVKVPVAVLARAKAVATGAKKPAPPEPVKAKKLLPREKVIRALQKLHPMD
ncbi:MAG: hypothetical protein IAE78_16925 [Myxococcus sp.]|nr:hypothetical protein [Myxococcus sp.]